MGARRVALGGNHAGVVESALGRIPMRLVTWNACKGQFNRKAPLLDRLDADIAVVQEIASPGEDTAHTLWFGDNIRQGIAVVAREPFRLRHLPQQVGTPKYLIPVAVDGPISFVLFAVWTQSENRSTRYVRAASTAIDMYAPTFRENRVVLLGDFNFGTSTTPPN